jgi:hypothetical protein
VRRRLALLACLLLTGGAGAYLVSHSAVGSGFVFESIPASRRPVHVLVDTEPLAGIDTVAVTQDLMNRWNSVAEAEDVFGAATSGGPYNGSTVGTTFGVFTNTQYEVALDDTGEILSHFGISGVLGITLKTVDTGSGRLLDFLVVVNTQPGALSAPGTGATVEELFRATLLHELGHALGFGHTPVGMTNPTSFGLDAAAPQAMPTMFPFRLPSQPQEGGTLEADDRAAAIIAYPGAAAGVGSISGTVRALSGAPVNEIAVRAGGAAGHVGTVTNTDGTEQGNFTIEGLPPGAYRVLIEAVNGRGGVAGSSLEGTPGSLGDDAFLHAADEYWQPGDTYDPAVDDPSGAVEVQVRGGRDTGGVDFVLDAAPLLRDDVLSGNLEDPDARLPVGASFRFVDYFAFHGTSGQAVTLTANASFTPQIRLLLPADLSVAAEALPSSGFNTALSHTFTRTGVHTVALFARGAAAGPNGGGAYTLRLQGAGAALPPAPPLTEATAALGPATPAADEVGSPTCTMPVLQVRLQAPSHEELWVDRVRVRAFGTVDDALDVVAVSLVHDRNGNGVRNSGDPVLATGAFGADDGTLAFDDLAFEVDAGGTADLLFVAEVDVQSVSSAGFPGWVFLPCVLLLRWVRPRRVVLLLLLCAIVPLSCGGGGGGSSCGTPFDPDGAIVTFRLQVDAGEILAFPSTSTSALGLPNASLASEVLSVSN